MEELNEGMDKVIQLFPENTPEGIAAGKVYECIQDACNGLQLVSVLGIIEMIKMEIMEDARCE